MDTVLPFGGGQDGKGELFVRKGELVGWSCYSMHRREDFYGEDAEVFRPERWMGEEGLRTAWEFLPFNGGARICLGRECFLFFSFPFFSLLFGPLSFLAVLLLSHVAFYVLVC